MTPSVRFKILVVDDETATLKLVGSFLDPERYEVTLASSANQALSLMKEKYFHVILSDVCLGGASGLSLIPHTKELGRSSMIIFMTGHGSLDAAVKAIGEGAFDYISKSNDVEVMRSDIIHRVERALAQLVAMQSRERRGETEKAPQSRAIIGEAPPMVALYRAIAKSALSNGHVLILGESGTGKELVARAIHDNGPLAAKPFVTVNCGALTETLLESELFGHIKGAFTGAIGNKRGLFEEAHEGTLFLDEIGDIPLSLQVKLLRAIQEGEIKPVGSSENRRVQVRVIAATHRDLEALIRAEAFREDLFYRLKVFLLEVPPLRGRKHDIPLLANHFISQCEVTGQWKIEGISDEAMKCLIDYPWPGNIRELKNAIERAAGMANSPILFPDDFPAEIVEHRDSSTISSAAAPSIVEMSSAHSDLKTLEQVEKEHIARILEMTDYNKSRAAEILKIDRGTLYRKAVQYGLSVSAARERLSCEPKEQSA